MEVFFPRTFRELRELFEIYSDGRILAGGTDLLVKLRKHGDKPSALFSIEHLSELQQVEEGKNNIFIGAGVTHQQLLELPIIKQRFKGMHDALSVLGSPLIRHSGTLGGNLCTASPAGDTLPSLYVLDAKIEIYGQVEKRCVPIAEFIKDSGKTILKQGEFVTGIYIPFLESNTFSAYYKVGKRKALAIAIASLAVMLQLNSNGTVEKIKLAWGSVGPAVMILPEVENFLKGKVLSDTTLSQAGKMAALGVSPIDDIRASSEYRRCLAANLLFRLCSESDFRLN
ncbi:xanthine dehydrogenase family protein subunit M [Clostridiaceae bacterium UIB06]|uniref:Xanthine dehydrogenase family protein subunit M n=1 Tax=Clostridium thailandense TaxID=2794346 RepID=A0A949TVX4_9CLOT|nr:xanthine dehydrogenase family protein subunit M [Clostridium thailandense]MBV7272440.1 xanthine dehydrogenase family protein subunit M [Clostridium thailandense]MCH5136964.1 xanthine dehydrogenase family protein subunit M [Clostridiaceae bacterium UIB06]